MRKIFCEARQLQASYDTKNFATLRSLLRLLLRRRLPQLPPLAPWREVVADGQPSFSSPSLRFGVRSFRLPCQWLMNKSQQLIIATIAMNTDEQHQ